MMAGLRRADDIVGRRFEREPHGGELRRGAIGQLLRRDPFPRRGLLHFLAMLVHAGHEQSVIAVEPFEAGDRIGGDPLIGMADMRRAIGIGNGGRNVESPAAGHG